MRVSIFASSKTLYEPKGTNCEEKFVYYYMGIAKSTADLSSARKKRVGCIIVKDNRVISMGYNGMPSGWDNECEHWIPNVPFYVHPDDRHIYGTFETKPEVLHAETNAISKLARSTESGEGADLFVTCTPCIECAKLIHQAWELPEFSTTKTMTLPRATVSHF